MEDDWKKGVGKAQSSWIVSRLKERNILVDGKPRKVKLLRVDKRGPFSIQVDNKTYEVKLASSFGYGTRVSINVSGKRHKVEIEKVDRNTSFSVKVDGRLYKVQYAPIGRSYPQIAEPMLQKRFGPSVGKSLSEKGVVTAALPGRVVSMKVKMGDSIKVGDALCVLEAMKMENEIMAPMAGVVREIMVSEGDFVDRGQALLLVK